MGSVVSNNKAVLIASVSAVGIGAFCYNKQSQKKRDQITTKQDIDLYLDSKYDMVETGFSTDIVVKYTSDNCLEAQTIFEIYNSQLEKAGDDYVKLTKQNRAQRRRLRKQGKLQEYVELLTQYTMDVEDVLEQVLKKLLYDLDIPKEIFEESVLVLMDTGYFQQLYMLQASVKQKIKEKIPSTKKLNSKQMKEICSYHVHILRNFPEEVHQILLRIPSENVMLVPTLINLLVQDLIFQKFGIEEEDQIECLKHTQSDLHDLLLEVESEMSNLLRVQGIQLNDIPQNLENFL